MKLPRAVCFDLVFPCDTLPLLTRTLNGEEIKPGGRFKILYEDNESMALIIKNVTAADAGKITVTARNELGACESEAELIIKGQSRAARQNNQSKVILFAGWSRATG